MKKEQHSPAVPFLMLICNGNTISTLRFRSGDRECRPYNLLMLICFEIPILHQSVGATFTVARLHCFFLYNFRLIVRKQIIKLQNISDKLRSRHELPEERLSVIETAVYYAVELFLVA